MANEIQEELEKMKQEVTAHEQYLANRKTGDGLADLRDYKLPVNQLPDAAVFESVQIPDADALIDKLGEKILDSKANLVDGKVPASELPSYVDDVIEGYFYNNKFYADNEHTEEIEGEAGKIYLSLDTNFTYRWSGSAFVQINVEYQSLPAQEDGTDVSLVTTGEKYNWNNKQDSLPSGNNNTYLHKNASTGNLEWSQVNEVPEITAGDEGKALVVSSGEATWGDVANGIEFNTAYNASTNKAATMSDIDTAIIATINANY